MGYIATRDVFLDADGSDSGGHRSQPQQIKTKAGLTSHRKAGIQSPKDTGSCSEK